MSKISVIVPVFNAEKYILDCLEALLHQTMDDIEIILVDDHCKDDSIVIAGNYIKSLPECRKIVKFARTEHNGGPGAAKNLGIEIAEGDYICFVDSDDYVEPVFCEKLYDCICAEGADMACCNIQKGNTIYRFPDCRNKRYFLTKFVTYAVCFIYNRAFITDNHICFPTTRSAEDSCFLICSILAADKIARTDDVLYHYLVHDNSISQSKNRKRAFQRIASFRQMQKFARHNGYNSKYRIQLALIMFKKCWLMVAKDLLLG